VEGPSSAERRWETLTESAIQRLRGAPTNKFTFMGRLGAGPRIADQVWKSAAVGQFE